MALTLCDLFQEILLPRVAFERRYSASLALLRVRVILATNKSGRPREVLPWSAYVLSAATSLPIELAVRHIIPSDSRQAYRSAQHCRRQMLRFLFVLPKEGPVTFSPLED